MTTATITGSQFGPGIKHSRDEPTTLDLTFTIDGAATTARLEHDLDDIDLDRLWLTTLYKHIGEAVDLERTGDTITALGQTWTVQQPLD